jgi:hypothetical protein
MQRKMTRVLVVAGALVLLTACVSESPTSSEKTWIEADREKMYTRHRGN